MAGKYLWHVVANIDTDISNEQKMVALERFQGDRFLFIAQPALPVKWVDSKRLACYNTIKFDRAGDTYGTAL